MNAALQRLDSQEIVDEVKSLYSAGRTLTYVHATPLKTIEWDKNSTVHENVNLPRKSIEAIVFFTNMMRDYSEKYVYHNIENVKVMTEGVPNSMYSQ